MDDLTAPETRIAAIMTKWLPKQVPGVGEVVISNVAWSKAAGFSADTIFVDAAWQRDGQAEHQGLVIRQQIVGHDLLHDAELRFQWEVMKALCQCSDLSVPTPGLIGIEEDAHVLGTPFLVMERLPGRIVPQHPNYNVGGWLHDMTPDDRNRVWRNGLAAMAAVHRIDWRDGFAALARGKEPGLSGFVDFIADWCHWGVAGREFPLVDAALDHLRKEMPHDAPINVLWGDPLASNTLFDDDGNVTGLIDWEMAALGPGEIDLAWWMLFDHLFSKGMNVTRLEGLPGRDETIEVYEAALGRPVSDLPYYEILTWLRMTMVSLRAVDRQVALGNFRAGSDAWSHNPSAQGLAERLGFPEIVVGQDFHDFIKQLMVRD